MNNKLIFFNSLIVLLMLPIFILAFDSGGIPNVAVTTTINDIIDKIFSIIWPIAASFITIHFIIIGILFSAAKGEADKIEKARLALIGGLIMVLMLLLSFPIPLIIRLMLPGI